MRGDKSLGTSGSFYPISLGYLTLPDCNAGVYNLKMKQGLASALSLSLLLFMAFPGAFAAAAGKSLIVTGKAAVPASMAPGSVGRATCVSWQVAGLSPTFLSGKILRLDAGVPHIQPVPGPRSKVQAILASPSAVTARLLTDIIGRSRFSDGIFRATAGIAPDNAGLATAARILPDGSASVNLLALTEAGTAAGSISQVYDNAAKTAHHSLTPASAAEEISRIDAPSSEGDARFIIDSVRRQIRALTEGLRQGRGWKEFDRLEQMAFSETGPFAQVESARVLLRMIGDPELIVRSRGFIREVGLQEAADLDAVSRFLFQTRPRKEREERLLKPLMSYTAVEMDDALPPVSPKTRRLLLFAADSRMRELPADSGMERRTDYDPVQIEKVSREGVGARNFGLPDFIQLWPLTGLPPARSFALQEADATCVPSLRILAPEELAILHEGRTRASRTLSNPSREHANFKKAAARVNEWVSRGEDLDLNKLQALGGILLDGTDHGRDAGRLRDFFNSIERPGAGPPIPFAQWELILANLTDFMLWYDANKSLMHPIELSALAYQQLVRIHPLVNANGRSSRLILDFILQRNGYLPASFDDVDEETIQSSSADVVERVALGILKSSADLKLAHDAGAMAKPHGRYRKPSS